MNEFGMFVAEPLAGQEQTELFVPLRKTPRMKIYWERKSTRMLPSTIMALDIWKFVMPAMHVIVRYVKTEVLGEWAPGFSLSC